MRNNGFTSNKVTINIPFSILEIIDRIMEQRVGDRETNVTRTSIALEMLKIGARVQKKQLDNIETGANPFDSRFEEQLSFIANKVATTDLRLRRLISIVSLSMDVNEELLDKIRKGVVLSDEEKTVIMRLFVEISELKKESVL